MPRFRDTTDFPDIEVHSVPRRPARAGLPFVEPGPARASPATRLQKITPGKNRALALAVADLNVTLSSGKMRAHAPLVAGHKAASNAVGRSSSAISEALAKQRAQAASQAKPSLAKAIAADRRSFNPTPGPKTVFGTQATIKPTVASRFRFAFPAVSYPCVVRKTRKEVLFALNKAGGASSRRPKRRGPYSNIGC